MQVRAADNTNTQTLDEQLLFGQVHFDRCEFFVFGNQVDFRAFLAETLYRDLIANPGNNHLAVVNILGTVNCQQVAIENTDVLDRKSVV